MRFNLLNNKYTYLEEIVLTQFLTRNSKHSSVIQAQINHAEIESRSTSDVGFITSFSVPEYIPALNSFSANKALDVYANHPDVQAGAGFLLWFENGRLTTLEGYVFMGTWPINELKFRIVTKYDTLCGELVKSNRLLRSSNYLG